MIRILAVFLCMIFSTAIWSVPGDFGTAQITIDGRELAGYSVINAVLYQDVSIAYDTTLQLYSNRGFEHYYYPKLKPGHRNVLHLIIEQSTGAGLEKPFFDLLVDIGDTLTERVTLPTDSSIFLFRNGNVSSSQLYATGQEGTFELHRSANSPAVQGSFSLIFDYPSKRDNASLQRISIRSELKVPEGNVATGGKNTVAFAPDREGRLKRNAFIAALTAAFIVLFAIR